MRTSLVVLEGETVAHKRAESPIDADRLRRLRQNITMLGALRPTLAPRVLEHSAEHLVLSVVGGETYSSEEAATAYPTMPWLTGAVASTVNALNAPVEGERAPRGYRKRFLRQVLRLWRYGASMPLAVQPYVARLLAPRVPWTLPHGDLTEWNIVVDSARESVALIDWEELAYRPALWDVFFLAFHRGVALEELTWQKDFLRQALAGVPARVLMGWGRAVAIVAQAEHLANDLRRSGSGAEPHYAPRLAARRENLAKLIRADYWRAWLAEVRLAPEDPRLSVDAKTGVLDEG